MVACGCLSKVAGYCQRLLVALIGCILQSNGCRWLSVKSRRILSKVAGYCQWINLGNSAPVMHLGTSLSEESDCKRLERAATV